MYKLQPRSTHTLHRPSPGCLHRSGYLLHGPVCKISFASTPISRMNAICSGCASRGSGEEFDRGCFYLSALKMRSVFIISPGPSPTRSICQRSFWIKTKLHLQPARSPTTSWLQLQDLQPVVGVGCLGSQFSLLWGLAHRFFFFLRVAERGNLERCWCTPQ